MGDSFARFRDLKGIGPATEARLHEAGIYTWETLAVAATALAAVRGEGDTLRDVANAVAARRAEAGEEGSSVHQPGGGERLESFLLRVALAADGAPQRSEVIHVRTMAEHAWSGFSPGELGTFIEEHSGVRRGAASAEEPTHDDQPLPRSRRGRGTARRTQPSPEHLVLLDAGKAIGGASRDIYLVLSKTGAANGDFDYRATLAARALGNGRNGEGWTTVGNRTGTGSASGDVVLDFPSVPLPPGIHRLQLRMEVRLPTPTRRPPALTVAQAAR
jgi:hypothetical protein